MKSCFVVDGIRTPIGKFGGSLAQVRADDLASLPLRKLMERHPEIPPAAIDDVMLGCANQAGEDNRNVARMALLLAGLPWSIPGETVNRLCASGLAAIVNASRAIRLGDADLILAGGVEHMTRGPWVISKASAAFGRDSEMADSSFGWRFINPQMKSLYGTESMGQTAENLASRYGISRLDQDKFACHSQKKTAQALATGRLEREIASVELPAGKGEQKVFTTDEFPKPESTLEGLSTLKPAFKPFTEGGTVTAGNSSGLNDGAAAVLLASSLAVQSYQLRPLARIVSTGVAGVEPGYMGTGPIPASEIALKRAGLTMDQMDIIELNEAFAAQVLACLHAWKVDPSDPRLNPNGGAIALGHPLGMTGARILYSAALELALREKQFALVTLCVGVGQGYACILERA
ncbi:MAG: acetyl-CoA C-acyltransferase [Saprospiraceae bacterium]|nr:acetyl-CoA C-acyltransferase [Saprospiraceae bacterium]MBP9210776.1 acetyl-CoA C-acyltransferase [Saprospiraceae bacterium]MBV6473893.1 Beta-ketoadipyl-CoA thiolase [Saprospiraceae bacterium]